MLPSLIRQSNTFHICPFTQSARSLEITLTMLTGHTTSATLKTTPGILIELSHLQLLLPAPSTGSWNSPLAHGIGDTMGCGSRVALWVPN